jgi:outer membrane autotransporter protein
MYSYEWDGRLLRNVWVLAQGESADIEKLVDMEAKIWGIEGGFDIQHDLHNTLGVFASYRKGQYDLSGKGSKLHSNIGSEIDINSYLAGLYYRYDKNFNWLFATVYGGIQEAEIETEDHIAKFDTDGVEFGASIEIGRTIPLANDLTLDPSVGLYYTQVNFDDADDNVGKHYEWEDIKHLEAELGAKLEKQFDNAKVYIKPSVIQTITGDDKVTITGLSKADTYHDQTLGRIEIGGRYGFTDALSAYAWANYTFGSSYDAIALGAGLNYAW